MQVLHGTKREITLYQWNEQLQKAEKRLADSKECFRRFGDNEDWIAEDQRKVDEIKQQIKEVTQYMDERGIQ